MNEKTSPKTVGDRLLAVRKRQKYSIDEVSRYCHIPPTILTAIESGGIEGRFPEVYCLLCFYSVSVHEIFAGYFVHSKSGES